MTFKIAHVTRYHAYCVTTKVKRGFKNIMNNRLKVTNDLYAVMYAMNHVTLAIRDQARAIAWSDEEVPGFRHSPPHSPAASKGCHGRDDMPETTHSPRR